MFYSIKTVLHFLKMLSFTVSYPLKLPVHAFAFGRSWCKIQIHNIIILGVKKRNKNSHKNISHSAAAFAKKKIKIK